MFPIRIVDKNYILSQQQQNQLALLGYLHTMPNETINRKLEEVKQIYILEPINLHTMKN